MSAETRTPERVAEHAQEAFWAAVAESYPEVTTGDFPPGDDFPLALAMERAIEAWLMWNWPEGSNPPGWKCPRCGDDRRGCDRDECRSM